MFVTIPGFQIDAPECLAPKGTGFYRALGLSSRASWFIMTLGQGAASETFLLAWDSDVVSTLDASGGELKSLAMVTNPSGSQDWAIVRIREIWSARGHAEADDDAYLFVDEEGSEHPGFALYGDHSLRRENLIARVNTAGSGDAT